MNVFSKHGSRVCVVKIDAYKNKIPVGTLQNPNLAEDKRFVSLTQLLLSMESLFDEINNPQKTTSTRGFVAQPAEPVERPRAAGESKPLATFRIDVIFRQNASWQGNVVWLEGNEEAQFRSVLELITLIDSALHKAE